MDDKGNTKKKGCGVMLAMAMLVLLILYVASSGPAIVKVRQGMIGQRTYLALYTPVEQVASFSPTTTEALRAYQRWCGSLIYVEYVGNEAVFVEINPFE